MKLVLGMEVGLSPGDFVLDEEPVPPPQKGGGDPQIFGPCLFGQTAGGIKMPLGTKVGLSPGDSVLYGDPAPSPQRGWSLLPNFRPISIVAKRLDASRCHLVWRERPQPRGLCVRC